MILDSISIANFKNISSARLEFSPNVNCLLGNNGMGKSNLLDAIHYLSFGKSFAGLTDAMLIRRGEDFAMLEGHYTRRGEHEELAVAMRRARRKSFKRGGKEYRRMSMHVGLFPAVMVSPADISLISGAPDERRRFIDMVIAQSDPQYLQALIDYTKAIEQRNSLLRSDNPDPTLISAYDSRLAANGAVIIDTRRQRIASLVVIFNRYHALVAPDAERVNITYSPCTATIDTADTAEALKLLLQRNIRRDLALGYTSTGPHRDDLDMMLDDMPLRRTASQGQAKTFTIALRLAQYEFLRDATGITPLLLLDDIFDKLDADRMERIMALVASDTFGQIFITDTNRRHLDEIVSRTAGQRRLWHVENGTFNPIDSL